MVKTRALENRTSLNKYKMLKGFESRTIKMCARFWCEVWMWLDGNLIIERMLWADERVYKYSNAALSICKAVNAHYAGARKSTHELKYISRWKPAVKYASNYKSAQKTWKRARNIRLPAQRVLPVVKGASDAFLVSLSGLLFLLLTCRYIKEERRKRY